MCVCLCAMCVLRIIIFVFVCCTYIFTYVCIRTCVYMHTSVCVDSQTTCARIVSPSNCTEMDEKFDHDALVFFGAKIQDQGASQSNIGRIFIFSLQAGTREL